MGSMYAMQGKRATARRALDEVVVTHEKIFPPRSPHLFPRLYQAGSFPHPVQAPPFLLSLPLLPFPCIFGITRLSSLKHATSKRDHISYQNLYTGTTSIVCSHLHHTLLPNKSAHHVFDPHLHLVAKTKS